MWRLILSGHLPSAGTEPGKRSFDSLFRVINHRWTL